MASTMQLEFTQAMSDFKTMFPDMDRDVIEAVLRANQGAVDATIDQLLAMSTDNQNEKLRNELDGKPLAGTAHCAPPVAQHSLINLSDDVEPHVATGTLIDTSSDGDVEIRKVRLSPLPLPSAAQHNTTSTATAGNAVLLNLSASGAGGASHSPLLGQSNNTGASPKQRPHTKTLAGGNGSNNGGSGTPPSSLKRASNKGRWNPPMLRPLPAGFLRIAPPTLMAVDAATAGSGGGGGGVAIRDFDLPDEQFAMMLQNEEFMNQLRWNQEFMNALEKEQQSAAGSGKSRADDDVDADFKERLKHMGKMSRKKFLQIARVFTWQRNKKTNTAKQIDSLPLKEEPSDDEDHQHQQQHHHHVQQQSQITQHSQGQQTGRK